MYKIIGIIDDDFNKKHIILNNIDGEGLNAIYKFLPVDTKFFKNLEYDILALFDNLDDELDGILIHSENYQALNLIFQKFNGQIQTIYIDPPFNKGQNANYLYNVKYKDSTWATMLENRINLTKYLLKNTGSIFVRCDYNGNWIVKPLMNRIFGKENFTNEIQINRSKIAREGVSLDRFATATDSIFYYRKSGGEHLFNPIFKLRGRESNWIQMHSPLQYKTNTDRTILGRLLSPPEGRHWSFSQEKINRLEKEGRVRINESNMYINLHGVKIKGMPEYLESEMAPCDSNWTDINGYSQIHGFSTENSEILLKRIIESTSNESDIVLDFFLGSGTTIAVAHKLRRKWVGIEMGEHFYTVVLPRMKEVLGYDTSGISKDKNIRKNYNENYAGGFFKYYDVEQYEDSLNNIEFDKSKEDSSVLNSIQHYFMKYILNYETNNSNIFLNVRLLENPFNYNLKIINDGEEKIVNIDLIETFNNLYEVIVKKVLLLNNDKKYIFVFGEKENNNILIVWRDLKNINYEDDKDFIYDTINKYFKDKNIDTLLTNGNNIVNNSIIKNGGKSLDPIYHNLIFGDN